MFISSVLLLLASLMPYYSEKDIDNSKYVIYDFLDAGNIDSAHFIADHAIVSSQKINYTYGTAKSIFIKSYLHRVNNELGESFVLNLKALKILHDSKDERTPKTLADIYLNTGEILRRHYQYDEAVKYYNKGLDVVYKHNLQIRRYELTYNMGVAMLKKGDFPMAYDLFEKSLNLSREYSDEWTILNSLNYLGVAALEMEKYELARSYFKQIELFRFDTEPRSKYLGFAFHNTGESYFRQGDNLLAESYFNHALDQNYEMNDSVRMFENQLRLAQLFMSKNDFHRADELGRKSLSSYSKMILSPENYQVFDLLTKTSLSLKNLSKASLFHHRYVEENAKFLTSQQEILQNSQQYKMEMLTANFFKDIEKQEQLAQLNQIIYLLLGLGLISFVFFQAKKYLLKRSLEQAVREVVQKKNLYL